MEREKERRRRREWEREMEERKREAERRRKRYRCAVLQFIASIIEKSGTFLQVYPENFNINSTNCKIIACF